MAISFCDEYGIDKELFKSIGALDIILDLDTKYFIDPVLLRNNQVPEFTEASHKVEKYFSDILALIRVSREEKDMYWKKADELLSFKEIKGTCLGYSNSGTSGNAIGRNLRCGVLRIIKDLLLNGEVEPIILELLGVFQEKIGCDRISDLVTFILRDDIIQYTKRVLKELKCENVSEKGLLRNPYNQEYVLLLPKEILSPLPVANRFDEIEFCCFENERVRREINAYFDLGERKKIKKEEVQTLIINDLSFREQLLDVYRNLTPEKYNFDIDPVGEIVWYEESKRASKEYPLILMNPRNEEELESLIMKICYHFKTLIENNGLWRLLYDDNCTPKHESAAQLLFFGIADSYCTANGVEISREVNNGRGPVDFKLSKSTLNKVLVEVKLTSNPQLKHGISKQLPIYMKQENTKKAIYLIIDNGHYDKYRAFQDYYNKLFKNTKEKIPYLYIDGNVQVSASKA